MTPLLRAVSGGRLCETRLDIVDGKPYYRKTRLCPDSLIDVANQVAGLNFTLLASHEWRCWETTIYATMHNGAVIDVGPRSILAPALPGRTLEEVLADADVDLPAVICAAVTGLRRLHETWLRHPDGVTRQMTHADATVRNVLYDAETGSAHWFDFETVHCTSMSSVERRADDLRAFLFSAAGVLPRRRWRELVDITRAAYGDDDVIREVIRAHHRRPIVASVFQVSQARMTVRDYIGFAGVLSRSTQALPRAEAA